MKKAAMKYNSSILKLSLVRIQKELYIWLLLIVCLFFVVTYSIDSLKIPSIFQQKTVDTINSIVLSLSCSYIAGMIFYILSEFLPQTRKKRTVLANAVEYLRLFMDDFSELSRQTWGDDWLTVQNAEEDVFKAITNVYFSENLLSNPIKMPNDLVCIFKEYVRKFDFYLTSAMSYEAYYSPEEYQQLVKISISFAFSQIRIHFDEINGTYYNPNTLMELIHDMIEVNKNVASLFVELERYKLNFQK